MASAGESKRREAADGPGSGPEGAFTVAIGSRHEALGSFALLFVALLSLAFFYTFFELYRLHPWMDSILLTLSMAAGAHSLRKTRRPLKLALAAFIPALVLTWLFELGGRVEFAIAGNLSVAAFETVVATSILVLINRSKRVTGDTLFGAVSVYLLIGLVWSHLYQVVDLVQPHAFTGDRGPDPLARFIYFSFTILTSLGLGDMLPLSAQARALTILEVIFGNLFLAVLVARLVALEISDRAFERQDRARGD